MKIINFLKKILIPLAIITIFIVAPIFIKTTYFIIDDLTKNWEYNPEEDICLEETEGEFIPTIKNDCKEYVDKNSDSHYSKDLPIKVMAFYLSAILLIILLYFVINKINTVVKNKINIQQKESSLNYDIKNKYFMLFIYIIIIYLFINVIIMNMRINDIQENIQFQNRALYSITSFSIDEDDIVEPIKDTIYESENNIQEEIKSNCGDGYTSIFDSF